MTLRVLNVRVSGLRIRKVRRVLLKFLESQKSVFNRAARGSCVSRHTTANRNLHGQGSGSLSPSSWCDSDDGRYLGIHSRTVTILQLIERLAHKYLTASSGKRVATILARRLCTSLDQAAACSW